MMIFSVCGHDLLDDGNLFHVLGPRIGDTLKLLMDLCFKPHRNCFINIFNARKETIVVKTTFVVIFQIYVAMTTSCLFYRTIYLWHIKKYFFFG